MDLTAALQNIGTLLGRDDGITVDEEAFSALIDKAGPFLQAGDGRNALKILDPVMEALVPAWLEQADWDETLHEFFPVLGQMIADAEDTVGTSLAYLIVYPGLVLFVLVLAFNLVGDGIRVERSLPLVDTTAG